MVVHVIVGENGDAEVVGSLKRHNPDWEIRTYSVDTLDSYVKKWFGGDLQGWLPSRSASVKGQKENGRRQTLNKGQDETRAAQPRVVSGDDIEQSNEEEVDQLDGLEQLNRSDRSERTEARLNVFRYLVLVKFGGVVYHPSYGVGSVPIFGELIQPSDRFVAVWNLPHSSAADAIAGCHVRQRSIRHDLFAATVNHPILSEVLDRITSMRAEGQVLSNENERTGEGVLTDTVVDYALRSTSMRHTRLLPASALRYGVTRRGARGRDGCIKGQQEYGVDIALVERIAQQDMRYGLLPVSLSVAAPQLAVHANPILNPTSTTFDIMVSNDAVSMLLMSYGLRGLPDRGKSSAGIHVEHSFDGRWGNEVNAAPNDSSTGRETSSAANRSESEFLHESLVELILRSMESMRPREKCGGKVGSPDHECGILVDVGAGYGLASIAAASEGHRVMAFELGPEPLEAFEESVKRNDLGALISVHRVPLGSAEQDGDYVCLRGSISTNPGDQSGYGTFYDDAALDLMKNASKNCAIKSQRRAGHMIVGKEHVAALKVSANGWEGHIMEGFLPLLQRERENRPRLISFEWDTDKFERAGYDEPLGLIETLFSLGYHSISHSGPICDHRWNMLMKSVGPQGALDTVASDRPVWCKLLVEDRRILLTSTTPPSGPEEVLLVLSEDS